MYSIPADLPLSSIQSIDLSCVCYIKLGSLLSQYPHLVLNQSLIPHPALIPGLLEVRKMNGMMRN